MIPDSLDFILRPVTEEQAEYAAAHKTTAPVDAGEAEVGAGLPEVWRPIPEWEGLYEVSNGGRVKALPRLVASYGGRVGRRRERVLKATPEPVAGHLRVTLKGNGRKSSIGVHRLVLMAFAGPCPEGMEACHNDGDPTNNDVSNLRWDTRESNVQDTLKHGQHYWARRTECGNGHPFTGDNVAITPRGTRRCRACHREWARQRRARLRSDVLAVAADLGT